MHGPWDGRAVVLRWVVRRCRMRRWGGVAYQAKQNRQSKTTNDAEVSRVRLPDQKSRRNKTANGCGGLAEVWPDCDTVTLAGSGEQWHCTAQRSTESQRPPEAARCSLFKVSEPFISVAFTCMQPARTHRPPRQRLCPHDPSSKFSMHAALLRALHVEALHSVFTHTC